MNTTTTGKQRLFLALALVAILIGLGAVIFFSMPRNENTDLPESREVFTLHDPYNMTVVVAFDSEPPIVRFIAPGGNSVDMGNIRYRHGGNFIQYFLPNAMPGVWRMAYDPLSNDEITTHYSVYMAHIFIRDFVADVANGINNGNGGNGILPVIFEVSADESGEFGYMLHAVLTDLDNSIADEILLAQGYGMLNEILSLEVDMDRIESESGFMLRLTASVQHGQAAILDTAWLDLRLG